MILKAKQRGDGKQLGAYLLQMGDNEHVELHELRGFVSQDLPSALGEIDAISRGTRAKKFFFSLSLNPPPKQRVRTEAFESAIERIEQRLGLTGQPRAIVFHEKDGRRHAHAVWSRIDSGNMRAIDVGLYKVRLRDIARDLYIEHGWQLPRGFIDPAERMQHRYSHHECQQARREEQDPAALKRTFQACGRLRMAERHSRRRSKHAATRSHAATGAVTSPSITGARFMRFPGLALHRDRSEMDALIFRHIEERECLQQRVSALMINGMLDKNVPHAGGSPGGRGADAWDGSPTRPALEQAAFWAKADGCMEGPIEEDHGHRAVWRYLCPSGRAVELVLVKDNGHAWPGGRPGSRRGDLPSSSLDATDVIWEFFKAHPR